MNNFSEEVKINRFNLDNECEKQVNLYHFYSNERAVTKGELDQKNDKLKLTLAEMDVEIRNNWDDNIDGKRTEGAISNKIECSPKIKELKEEIRNTQSKLYILESATFSLDHRKEMINNLVKLLIGGFYAYPNGGSVKNEEENLSVNNRKKLKSKLEKKYEEE